MQSISLCMYTCKSLMHLYDGLSEHVCIRGIIFAFLSLCIQVKLHHLYCFKFAATD